MSCLRDLENMEVDKVRLLSNSQKIVFFGGAGTSTESGIPDFRSSSGIYTKIPEDALSSHNLYSNPKEFFGFYRKLRIFPHILPHEGHKILKQWEDEDRIMGIITQNIDGLHQKAGSKKVVELHGTTHRNYCISCKKSFSLDEFVEMELVPYCGCGGMIRPDVTLFGEMLSKDCIEEAIRLVASAEILIVGGTSLQVYPAAGFIDYFNGRVMLMINLGETHFDLRADVVIHQSFKSSMVQLDKMMRSKSC